MKKVLLTIGIILLIGVIIGGAIFYMLYLKPNSDYNKYRDGLTVEEAGELDANGDYIHFLKTGSSDAILLQSNGEFALIDCAEDNDNPRGFEELVYRGYEQEVLDYLKANASDENGIVTLDFVLGTHSHSDHIGGFDTVISDDSIKINRAYLKEYNASQINEHEVEAWDNQEVYDQMVNALNAKNVPIISNVEENEFMLGDFKITLFNTVDDNSNGLVGENDNSFGVLVEKAGARVFLAGDIDNKSGDEDRLAPEIGKIDILKVGHHSYSGSTTANWLKTLNPEVCVVTNNYGQTDKNTLRRITRIVKSPILVTGAENGVLVEINDDGSISYFNGICDWE